MDKKKIVLIIFYILLPLFLVFFSYTVTLSFITLTPAQQSTIRFLQGKEELKLNYTTLELSHLRDVQQVMKYTNYVFYALLLFSTWIIIYYKKDKEQLQKMFKYGGITTVASISIILIVLVLRFNTLFVMFHQIFFPQGNWIFPPDSLLIQTFPSEFFVRVSVWIFGLSLFFGILFILLALSLLYGSSRQRS